MRLRSFATLIAILLTAVVTIGCGIGGGDTTVDTGTAAGTGVPADDTPTHAPVSQKIGGTLEVTTGDTTITYTLSKTEQRTKDQFGMSPDGTADVFLLAYLTVKVTSGTHYTSPLELSLVERSGAVRDVTYATFAGRDQFDGRDLTTGQHTAGWITFAVKRSNLKGARIQLKIETLFTDTAYGYWTL